MIRQSIWSRHAAWTAALLLAACGGGGGEPEPSEPPTAPPPDVQAPLKPLPNTSLEAASSLGSTKSNYIVQLADTK